MPTKEEIIRALFGPDPDPEAPTAVVCEDCHHVPTVWVGPNRLAGEAKQKLAKEGPHERHNLIVCAG